MESYDVRKIDFFNPSQYLIKKKFVKCYNFNINAL